MGFRRKLEEFEADLYKEPKPFFLFRREPGELERKKYDDGEEILQIKTRPPGVAAGGEVDVYIDGNKIASVAVQGRFVRAELNSTRGDTVARVAAGSRVAVKYLGRTIMTGKFRRD